MKLLSDEPISNENEDLFGFSPYVETLRNAIINTKILPYTIGIIGEYGTGKTSLMRLLCNWFIDNDYKTIWFNPWIYWNQKDLQSALMRAILLKIYVNTTDHSMKKTVWRMLQNIGWPTFDTSIYGTSDGLTVKNKPYNKDEQKTIAIQSLMEPSYLKRIESEFSIIVQDFMGETGKFIIFIDGLEDSIPDNANMVLESLRSYCDKEHSVFILSLGQSVINQENQNRVKGKSEDPSSELLKKNIQFSFVLPKIQFEELQDRFRSDLGITDNSTQIWSLLRYGLGSNPRKIKNFINYFSMLQTLFSQPELSSHFGLEHSVLKKLISKKIPFDNKLFYGAKLLVMQISYPDFYNYLKTNPSGWKKYEKVINAKRRIQKDELLKKGGADKEPSKEEILNNDPGLAVGWWNRGLRMFMMQTSGHGLPKPPSAPVLKLLEQTLEAIRRSNFAEIAKTKS